MPPSETIHHPTLIAVDWGTSALRAALIADGKIVSQRHSDQGILQIAVAHVHLERGNLRGATILLGEGVGRLSAAKPGDLGLDLPLVRDQARLRLEALQRETDPVVLPVPELRVHS